MMRQAQEMQGKMRRMQEELANRQITAEAGGVVKATVNGKLVFNTEGSVPGNAISPQPQCDRGYLIGSVVDAFGRPIKFDGLIGDAVLRETGTAVGAYTAIPIQADPFLAPGDPGNGLAPRELAL